MQRCFTLKFLLIQRLSRTTSSRTRAHNSSLERLQDSSSGSLDLSQTPRFIINHGINSLVVNFEEIWSVQEIRMKSRLIRKKIDLFLVARRTDTFIILFFVDILCIFCLLLGINKCGYFVYNILGVFSSFFLYYMLSL